ncbi:reticulon-4 receptor-like 2 isoform X2 [Xenopus laevis]|uniref:LRRCT domain-containing protein n=2 Tax=Xenopus laevis TaxID=8355 RepID=A0A974CEY4_XENLA|nr:reticulon-4 receptor-like 2 isoform X2 [Xenopus laevis]OCT72059.1 hypothetical protein XELAEV_18035035mg [Xenopus laevis]
MQKRCPTNLQVSLHYLICFTFILPFSFCSTRSLFTCPTLCTCYPSPPTASCQSQNLSRVPFPLPSLAQRVFLQNNHISEIGPGLFSHHTSVLWLFSNHISLLLPGVFNGLENLEELDLGNNPKFPFLQSDTFDGLKSLRSLHLYRCHIYRLPSGLFRGLYSLRYLYLQHNRLTVLPVGLFRDLFNLTQLFLHGNLLQSLPAESFFGLSSLDRLLLHNNRLVVVSPRAFVGLKSLTILFLFNNSLPALPGDCLKHLTSLQFLRLNGNPWHCDCTCRSLWGWFHFTPGVSSSPVSCNSPPALKGRDLRILEERDLWFCTSNILPSNVNLSGLAFPPKPSSFYIQVDPVAVLEAREWDEGGGESGNCATILTEKWYLLISILPMLSWKVNI